MIAWLRACACTGLGLAVLTYLVPAMPLTGDGQHYVEFVRNGLQGGASSWHERRLLGPLLVSVLPLDPLDGFRFVTLVALAVTALCTWLAARELTASEVHALAAIPLLFGTWAAAPNVREFALVDPLAWAFVAAVWLCGVRRQWFLAAALAAVGVLAKEVVVLAALAAAAAAWDARRPWQAGMVGAPAVLAVLTLTLVFPGSGSDAGAYLVKWVQDGLGSLGPVRVVYLVFVSYAALWLLVPAGFAELPSHLKRATAVFLAAAVGLPFVGSPERMQEAIFPAVVACAVAATTTWRASLVWLFALCNMVFVARVGGDARIPTAVAWAALALAVSVAAWNFRPGRAALRAPLPAAAAGGLPDTTARSP